MSRCNRHASSAFDRICCSIADFSTTAPLGERADPSWRIPTFLEYSTRFKALSDRACSLRVARK